MFNKLFLSLTIVYFVNCTYLNNVHQPYNINLAGNVNPSVQSGAVNYGGGAYGQGEQPCPQEQQPCPQEQQPCPQEQQPCPQSTNPNIYVNQNVNVKGDNAQYQQPEQQPPYEQEQQPPCEQEQQPPCEQEQPPCPSCGGLFHGYGGCQSCGGMFHGLGGYGGYRGFGGIGY
ncbi:hypothetical protein K502DRAFT_349387 [Neoconidiobolus thromboides FSU 785]|nr:hypothetical protein K502DRAFT_349387 [Neoconidiobolus thromboides FSU 785]